MIALPDGVGQPRRRSYRLAARLRSSRIDIGLSRAVEVSEFRYSMIRPARDCSRHEEHRTRLHGEHTFHGFASSPGPEARGPARDNSQGLARRIRLFQGHHFGAVAFHGSLLGGQFHERQRRAHGRRMF